MYEVIITSLVLIFVIFAIVSRKVPTIAVGLLIPLLLSVTGVIPAATAFSGIGGKNIFLIIGALAIGDACFRTGLTDLIGEKVIGYTKRFRQESLKLLLISLLAAAMSAFLSSFGVQVAFLSLIIVLSQILNISKTRSLMALGFSATVGGTWSIIGTPIMLMSRSTYESAVPGDTIGMFEITRVALPVGMAAILMFCFVTSRFLPNRCLEEPGQKKSDVKREKRQISRRDCIITAATLAGFIVLVALDGKIPIPANMVTVIALLVLGATGISTVDDIVKAIHWDTIFFIVGITVLSDAMASSGLSDLIGKLLIRLIGQQASPYMIIGAICIVSAVITQLMSNSGAFGVVLPFLPVIASSLQVDLKPLIAAAAIACSCGFCLPLAAPSYLILAKEGNIRVGDWMKQGLPVLAVCLGLTILLVPMVWPL